MKWWKRKEVYREQHQAVPDPEEMLPSMSERCYGHTCKRDFTRFLCVCGQEFVCSRCGRVTTPTKEERRMIKVYAVWRK